jgi:hypothetical protein
LFLGGLSAFHKLEQKDDFHMRQMLISLKQKENSLVPHYTDKLQGRL